MRIAIAATCLLISACTGLKQEPGSAAAQVRPALPAAQNPWSEPARAVLIERCGQCHLGSLPTANRRAMAIYDLAEPRWDARLKPENYAGITRRVTRQASQEQKAVVEKYLHHRRSIE